MFTYTTKRVTSPYRPMPIEQRVGKVPEQGFCSVRPAKGDHETLRASSHGISAHIAGEPLDEKITLHHEALQVRVMEKIPDPPEIADVLPEVRRLLLEGKGAEADTLSVETAKKRGYGDLLKFLENDPRNIELPVSAYHTIAACNIRLLFDRDGEPEDYLRTMDFRTGEAAVYWSDDRGNWVRRSFTSEADEVFVQLITSPTGQSKVNVTVEQTIPQDWRFSSVQAESMVRDGALVTAAHYPFGGGHVSVTAIYTDGEKQAAPSSVRIIGATRALIITKIKRSDTVSDGLADGVVHELARLPHDYMLSFTKSKRKAQHLVCIAQF